MTLSHSANLMTASLDAGTQCKKLMQVNQLSAEIENLLDLLDLYPPLIIKNLAHFNRS